MQTKPTPYWAFELYCLGVGDLYCAYDYSLPIPPLRRIFWAIRGEILTRLFCWWRWEW